MAERLAHGTAPSMSAADASNGRSRQMADVGRQADEGEWFSGRTGGRLKRGSIDIGKPVLTHDKMRVVFNCFGMTIYPGPGLDEAIKSFSDQAIVFLSIRHDCPTRNPISLFIYPIWLYYFLVIM
ncbi:hypothetical protein ACPRNU_09580 [Chromobacterium vaccinii]|uniref:hypothetical protein n=1 Tax=Chromobacterium TaxID=535 RepID=UPI00130508CC|nr:hypothetical protein [Chromobacterium sp. ATCC 53434]